MIMPDGSLVQCCWDLGRHKGTGYAEGFVRAHAELQSRITVSELELDKAGLAPQEVHDGMAAHGGSTPAPRL